MAAKTSLFWKPIRPMSATLVKEAFDSPDHLFEVKWDGIRSIAFVGDGRVRLQTRTLRDTTFQYPELLAIGKYIDAHEVILDGEIVTLDELGRASFERLQQRMNLNRPADILAASRSFPVIFYVFDILYLDGEDLTGLPLTERRERLQAVVHEEGPIRLSHVIDGDGTAFYEAAVHQGLEGIIAKRKTSTYQAGRRTRDWLKVKRTNRQEFVIGGWTSGAGNRTDAFGSLLLGVYEGEELVFAGHVGTGFDDATLQEIRRLLAVRRIDAPPFNLAPETNTPAQWVRPDLVCEVEFNEWTSEGRLRGPSFKGLRWDKEPAECRREAA